MATRDDTRAAFLLLALALTGAFVRLLGLGGTVPERSGTEAVQADARYWTRSRQPRCGLLSRCVPASESISTGRMPWNCPGSRASDPACQRGS